MAAKHFKQLGLGSFFGSRIYERVVPRDHFLVQSNRVIDWDSFTEVLLPALQGFGERRAAAVSAGRCGVARRRLRTAIAGRRGQHVGHFPDLIGSLVDSRQGGLPVSRWVKPLFDMLGGGRMHYKRRLGSLPVRGRC